MNCTPSEEDIDEDTSNEANNTKEAEAMEDNHDKMEAAAHDGEMLVATIPKWCQPNQWAQLFVL
jgi:type VI protein secretion system component VasF